MAVAMIVTCGAMPFGYGALRGYTSRTMSAPLLGQSWKHAFEGALPVGFLLRQHYPERWLRVHSLPESKRYPSCPSEYDELLNRHNAVAAYTLGEGSKCSLFIARFGENREWSDTDLASLMGGVPTHALASEDPEEPIQFFALQVAWRLSAFDMLIRAAADDQTGPVLFANMASQTIYVPYDGGADLFFSSPAAVTVAKDVFRSWLSAREDGL